MPTSSPSPVYGIALVASGAVGAGIFSLPIVSAGMWFVWSILFLTLVWLANLAATLLLLENNLRFAAGASFDTLVNDTLGPRWNALNNLAIVFIMYILLYAYFSASTSIAQSLLPADVLSNGVVTAERTASLAGLMFGAIIALLVWTGTAAVGRLSSLLLAAMLISFALSTGGLLWQVELGKLLPAQADSGARLSFAWAAIPYYVTAFACAGLVPSLVKYYAHDVGKIKMSIGYGSLLALILYILWITATFGNLERAEFAPIIEAGGNVGVLVDGFRNVGADARVGEILGWFSNFAITTSFLSIGLGLFDYIADRFGYDDSRLGRMRSAVLTFVPPALFSLLFPDGFILAIGYAGLAVLFSFYLVPVMLVMHDRRESLAARWRLRGGMPVLGMVLLFALLAAACKLLANAGLLARFPL